MMYIIQDITAIIFLLVPWVVLFSSYLWPDGNLFGCFGINESFFLLCRGPPNGTRGKVVLTFDNNSSSKIGVKFDKLIPDGVDLGGYCEGGYGYFCNGIFFLSCKFNKFGCIKIMSFSYNFPNVPVEMI